MIENKNNIILVIIIFVLIYIFYEMNCMKENFTSSSTSSPSSTSIINDVSSTSTGPSLEDRLNIHINNQVNKKFLELSSEKISESIKNLGIIARKLIDNGELEIPGDLYIHNDLKINNNLDVLNDINLSKNLNVTNDLTINGKFNLLPEGTIVMWGENEIPSGWVLCDGSYYIKKEFKDKFVDEIKINLPDTLPANVDKEHIISLRDNDEVNNQNVSSLEIESITEFYLKTPNLSGRFILGAGKPDLVNNHSHDGGGTPTGYVESTSYDIGWTGGERRHVLTREEMPNHIHHVKKGQFGRSGNCGSSKCQGDAVHPDAIGATGGGQGGGRVAHNNMPPYHTLNFIMKTYLA